ncbi:hypothetical protein Hanom_Chr12g01072111 [Helianthus anomalus]
MCEKEITVLSLERQSLVGMSRDPNTLSTSSRAITCHSGCIANNTVVHVIKLDVVCSPARKKLLHSSAMSGVVITIEDSFLLASIISPSRSFGPFIIPMSPHVLLLSITLIKLFFITLCNFQDSIFLFVGKNLKHQKM